MEPQTPENLLGVNDHIEIFGNDMIRIDNDNNGSYGGDNYFSGGNFNCGHSDDNFSSGNITNRGLVSSPGYRFCPSDEELVVHYLARKADGQPLPAFDYMFDDVDVYKLHPKTLAERYQRPMESMVYFFSPRQRKGKNGTQFNRKADIGFWKATGCERPITYDDRIVGYKRILTFYERSLKENEVTITPWIMHEFRLNLLSRPKSKPDDMRLDDFVLCRIHNKAEKIGKFQPRNSGTAINNISNDSGLINHEPVPETNINNDPVTMNVDMCPSYSYPFLTYYCRPNNSNVTFIEPPPIHPPPAAAQVNVMPPLQLSAASSPPPPPHFNQYPNSNFNYTPEDLG